MKQVTYERALRSAAVFVHTEDRLFTMCELLSCMFNCVDDVKHDLVKKVEERKSHMRNGGVLQDFIDGIVEVVEE